MSRSRSLSLLIGLSLCTVVSVAPCVGEPQHVSVTNQTDFFTLDVYWQALDCLGISDGITLVCHHQVLTPGQAFTYRFGDLTSFRQVRVALSQQTVLTTLAVAQLVQDGIIAVIQISEYPDDAPLSLIRIIPFVLEYLLDLQNYTDFFPTRHDSAANILYTEYLAELLLERASKADLGR